MRGRKQVLAAAAIVLAVLGCWQVAAFGYIHAKAQLAQHLIASAWQRAQASGLPSRPWPGADLKPVARLTVPSRHVELYVLDNASARALAFGPAHVTGTAPPAEGGNSVIVAHRDTHFAFLRGLALGDAIEVDGMRGHASYRVREVSVVHQSDTRVLEAGDESQLTLITCFPFHAARPGTEMRYVVIAQRVA